jgi:hypothetical protein
MPDIMNGSNSVCLIAGYRGKDLVLTKVCTVDAADGRPLTTAIFQPTNTTDTTKSQRVFNFKYRTMEETTRDTIEEYKRRGWVGA